MKTTLMMLLALVSTDASGHGDSKGKYIPHHHGLRAVNPFLEYDAGIVNGRLVEYLNEGKANTLENTFFTDEDGNRFPIRVGKTPIYDYDSLGA